MSNPFYNASGFPADGATNLAASMRAELALVSAGFDKFPALTAGQLVRVNDGGTALTTDAFVSSAAWTPVLTADTPGDLAITYSSQLGKYVRIGNLMVLTAYIAASAFTFTTTTGSVLISGLPVASSITTKQVGGSGYMGNVTWVGKTQISVVLDNGVIRLYGWQSGDAAPVIMTFNRFTTASPPIISFTLVYLVG